MPGDEDFSAMVAEDSLLCQDGANAFSSTLSSNSKRE